MADFKNGDIFNYKKYNVNDIKVIKDVVKEQANSEEKEYQEELNELEKLEEIEKNQKEEI